MSGFAATASTTTSDDVLVNDGWFPNLSLAAIRDVTRMDGTVTPARLRDVTRYAVSSVNRQLHAFKAKHVEGGAANLAAVDPAEIDGQNRLVMLYERAVASLVKAELIERYRDLDVTDSGQRRAAEMDPAAGESRRNSSWAVRDILGLPHTVVELI